MKFYSTKKKAPHVDFKTALFQGIAPDGGLYMPTKIPQVSLTKVKKAKSLLEVAFIVLRPWIADKEIPDVELKKIIKKSFVFPIPLVTVGDYSFLEIFHGPTLAFKDVAASFLAQLFAYYLKKEKRTITILVSTSGDTGAAIAQAFSGIKQVKVGVFYPKGKVSIVQAEQMNRAGENVMAFVVDGVFDDCQAFVKKAFVDKELAGFNLTSANSINIGRLIPQIVYYFWAYVQSGGKKLSFVVPSGNMGNATAAFLAHKMGMPIDSILLATNENDIAVNYFKTGVLQSKKSVQTLSNAMDVGNPSNFERILELIRHSHQAFLTLFSAVKITDSQTVQTIKNVYVKEKYLLDFHTAVAWAGAEKMGYLSPNTVIVSPASPLKFAKELFEATGIKIDNSDILKNLRMKEKRVISSKSDYASLKKISVKSLT